jgi:hypothetical protein
MIMLGVSFYNANEGVMLTVNQLDYCATSTECYQYRKSVGPTVTYAWHNLTCNPSSCMLIASDGAPPPVPPPFSSSNPNEKGSKDDIGTSSNGISKSTKDDSYYHNKPFHNPAAVALTVVCSLVLIVASVWVVRLFKKKNWWPHIRVFSRRGDGVARTRKRHDNRICTNSISSVPRSAPPSFSSTPPEMAIVHCSHEVNGMFNQNTIYSARSSASSSQIEPLPSYLSPDSSLPKYEQAIVTQIRGWRSDDSSSSSTDNQITSQPLSSMWVPVYFSHPSHFRHFNNDNATNLYGVPSQHLGAPLQSFWIHPTPGTLTSSSPGTPNQSENDSTRNENATTNTDVNANTNAP